MNTEQKRRCPSTTAELDASGMTVVVRDVYRLAQMIVLGPQSFVVRRTLQRLEAR